MLNEHTSPNASSIAGRIVAMKNPRIITDKFWKEIQSVAASALTQAPDKSRSLTELKKNPPKPLIPFGREFFKHLKKQ